MKKFSVWAALFVVFLMALGCVPNRKIVYLQQKDLNGQKGIERDSVLRTHPMQIAEYRIQPLDILNIQFETLTDDTDSFNFLNKLSSQNRQAGGAMQPGMVALNGIFVNTEGMVEYPVLGPIRLAGLTIFEAEKAIRTAASRFVPDVVVRVRMLNFRFTILGEVVQENVVVANNPRLTLMEAIGMAGGFTDLADRSLVKIVRQRGATSEVFYVNLLDEAFIESPNYFVQQNDVIVVPPLKQRAFRRYFAPNLGILASALSLAVLWFTIANNSNN